jgi:peptidoglycan pentaglycine glycine transferase (the first glycine)
MRILYPSDSFSWNRLIGALPDPHLLQTWEWAQVKARYGWQPVPLVWEANNQPVAAAMVLKRPVPAGGFGRKMCLLYAPKGPILDWSDCALRQRVLDDLQRFARQQGAIFLKIDPDVRLAWGAPGSSEERLDSLGQDVRADLERRGWLFSPDQIQFRNTLWLDLSPSEEALLARMKQKTRYNIRLAERKGVRVRWGTQADFPLLYRLYDETSVRDGFVIRQADYYRTVWGTFLQTVNAGEQANADRPGCLPLIAEVEGQAGAGLFLFWFAGRGYYLYGMSSDAHREKMPNYLLQWEAIRLARTLGCRTYDLWGAPDEFVEDDRLWGVFRFKEGLGGQVIRTLGAWDFVPQGWLYRLYTQVMPGILDWMRARGRARARQQAGV